MRRLTLFFLLLLQPFLNWAEEAPDPNASHLEFLLTYPRSGTNLLSCYIQALTEKPIGVAAGQISNLALNRLNVPLNSSKKTLYRAHHGNEIKEWNKNQNKLICIVRNYKECISREHAKKSKKALLQKVLKKDPTVLHYLDNIKVYDGWNPEKRLLIYYEDLITHPVEEVKKVLTFLEEKVPTSLNEQGLKDISLKTLDSYHHQHKHSGGSHSKGEDLLYHSKKLSKDQIQEWDQAMKTLDPDLYTRYLKRYEG